MATRSEGGTLGRWTVYFDLPSRGEMMFRTARRTVRARSKREAIAKASAKMRNAGKTWLGSWAVYDGDA